MNLKQMLEKTARELPQKEAIILGSRRVSYQELDETSNRVANALMGLGMKKGDHIAILQSDSPEWLTGYFGIIKAGGVVVVLNSRLKASELSFLLRDSDSKILLTEKTFCQMLSSILPTMPFLKHTIEADGDVYKETVGNSSSASPVVDIKDEDEATIIYVAGASGKPKGAVHTHASIASAFPTVSEGLEQKKEDIVINPIPLSSALSLIITTQVSFMKGSTLVIVPRFTPRAILETVEKKRGTILYGVPAMHNALAALDEEILARYDLSSLKMAVTAGAKSTPDLSKKFEDKLGLTLCEIYGLTEYFIISMGTLRNRKLGTAGKPIGDVKIIDDSEKEVPQGMVGKVIAKGPYMMKGYYKMPQATAQVIKDGYFHTGNSAKIDEDGYLSIVEEESLTIVTSAGINISATEVENVLLEHPSIAKAALVGIPNRLKGQIPTAFIVLKEGKGATEKDIRSFCRQRLADFKLPKRINFVDNLPKTGSGEIDRKQIREKQRR